MIARARPLLGTIVSIRADAPQTTVEAAFEAVSLVHRLMSLQSPASDLCRVSRDAHQRPIQVHPWTFAVLRRALEVSRASGGAFDPACNAAGADYRDIELLGRGRVRLRRRGMLDLNGIAKGFAVDRAVHVLRGAGARSGSVNAGGDLRVFGEAAQTIRVRLPREPRLSLLLANARNRAFATSGPYFGGRLVDGRTGAALCADHSITVSARSCMIADALTKVVAALGPWGALLERFGATAYRVDAGGKAFMAGTPER